MFEELDRPALKPLPPEAFTFAQWKKARVNIDYHIEIERHYYSVPYQLVHQGVEAHISASTVEIFQGPTHDCGRARPVELAICESKGSTAKFRDRCFKIGATVPAKVGLQDRAWTMCPF